MVHDILARYPDLMVRHLITRACHLTAACCQVLLSPMTARLT